jgi:hypothetical protein
VAIGRCCGTAGNGPARRGRWRADRRDELSRSRAQILNRLHRLLAELIGGAQRHLSSFKARALLATMRRRDLPGRTRRQLAVDLIGELEVIDRKLKELTKRLGEAVPASGSGLLDVFGIGPAGAARILADVGDVARFPDRHHFASWTGTAPIDASSGDQQRHRLSRAGNRRLNHVLYIAGIAQIRHDTPGRAYYRRKLAEGRTSMEAMRCLRRRPSDVIYRQLVTDAANHANQARPAGPGGHPGATLQYSAADRSPDIGTSDQPLPGPAPTTLTPTTTTPKTKARTRTWHHPATEGGAMCGRSEAFLQRSPPFARAASSVAASISVKVAVSILSINGPVNRPIGPPLGTYR